MFSGSGKKEISALFLLYILLPVYGQNEKSYKFQPSTGGQTNAIILEDGSIVINYRLPQIDLNEFPDKNGSWFRMRVPGHVSATDPGKPEIPVYSQLITIPDKSEYQIKISDVKTARVKPGSGNIRGILYPAQESEVKKEQQERPPFRIDQKTYGTRGFYGRDTVKIEYLGRVRDKNLANLYISPVRYNAASNIFQVITSMKIEILFKGTGNISKSASAESVSFSESLSKGVLNYNSGLITGYTDKPVGMIILTDTTFRKSLKPLLEWKTQKGFNLKVLYRGGKYAGVTYTELRDTIKGIYDKATENEPAPDYLLIIGDINYIPYYGAGSSGNVTDMYYGEIDGNGDYIPELYVGRLPVKDTNEVKAVVNKIIEYEKFGFAPDNKFYSDAISTPGSDAGYANYMNGQVKYSVANYLTKGNNINEHHFYYPYDLSKQKDSIIKVINSGTSFINYTGHGDAAGWLHLNIKVPDTASIKNRSKYPFIVSNACRTAQYSLPNSFGNRMVLERNKGAIGFIGCSNDSYWDEDYYWAVGLTTITDNPVYAGKGLGAIDRMFHTHNELPGEWYVTMGQINYAGNLSVSASNSVRKKYYWETYNLVGDPSIIPIVGKPNPFSVSLPDTLPNGIKSLSLGLEPFSYIAVSHFDTLWDASFAGASGSVTIDMPGLSNDSCQVVITGQNRIPLIKKIYFSNFSKEFLNLSSTLVNDNLGNNDKKADFGESFYLSLNVSNLGLEDATNAYVKISSSAEWIKIENDSAYIGILPHQSTVSVNDKLRIKVSDNVPDLGISTLNLLLKSKNTAKSYVVDLVLHAPDLKILSYLIDDNITGDGDHIADPGETFYMVFRISNQGSSDASGRFSILSQDAGITILQPETESGVLKSGQTSEIPLLVRVSDYVGSGSYISFASKLISFPFTISKDFVFRVGRIRESFEALSFNIFPWINSSAVPWTISQAGYYEGAVSARSGSIGHNTSTSLLIKTYYASADTLKFYCKVSSEPNYDFLAFNLNGREIFKKSGEVPWTRMSVPVPQGLNRMEWIYKKDLSVTSGSDAAWIDMIDFANSGPVSYIGKDLNVAKIEAPGVKDQYGQEYLKVKVLNTGKDIINGFNLAYSINGRTPTSESFDNKIIAGPDTVTVTFRNKIDLSRYGIYKIAVFGTGNNDDYILNDTARISLENTRITESMSVFPNPFSDQLTVVLNSQYPDKILITVSNTSGRILYSSEKSVLAGQSTFILNDLKLSQGEYLINIHGKMTNKTVPVLKINK